MREPVILMPSSQIIPPMYSRGSTLGDSWPDQLPECGKIGHVGLSVHTPHGSAYRGRPYAKTPCHIR